jgi:hypothetical protein
MICTDRHDKLLSQHVEVALVYKDMLGLEEARAYLEREHVPEDVAERILNTERRRQTQQERARFAAPPPSSANCRRRNRVHDAIVEAALKIERTLGSAWAFALLIEEEVPEEVALRVLAQGPRQVRIKRIEG